MKKNFKKGFTLIELLVVVAIVALLASIVLASLNSARNKGSDAAVKSNLEGARSQAELFYSVNNLSYNGVCASTIIAGVKPVYDQIDSAASAAGLGSFANDAVGTLSTATCNDTALGWAAEVPIKVPVGMWCVDSQGKSKWEAASSFPLTTTVTCT